LISKKETIPEGIKTKERGSREKTLDEATCIIVTQLRLAAGAQEAKASKRRRRMAEKRKEWNAREKNQGNMSGMIRSSSTLLQKERPGGGGGPEERRHDREGGASSCAIAFPSAGKTDERS